MGNPELQVGATIRAESSNRDVGDFTYPEEITEDLGPDEKYALFLFEAKKPGTTTIKLSLISTGDPWRVRLRPARFTIEVIQCYEALASGLITGNLSNVFTRKNICDLGERFLLSFHGPSQAFGGVNVNIISQAVTFSPDLTESHGTYHSDSKFQITGLGQAAMCTETADGEYDLTFHTTTWTEGDLELSGEVVLICEKGGNVLGSLDHSLLVQIKALEFDLSDPAHDTCEEQ